MVSPSHLEGSTRFARFLLCFLRCFLIVRMGYLYGTFTEDDKVRRRMFPVWRGIYCFMCMPGIICFLTLCMCTKQSSCVCACFCAVSAWCWLGRACLCRSTVDTHLFRNGAQILLLMESPATFRRSLRFFRTEHEHLLHTSSLACCAVGGYQLIICQYSYCFPSTVSGIKRFHTTFVYFTHFHL